MRVDDFDFDLPQERIALTPAEPRDSARMLHVGEAGFLDRGVGDLPNILRAGDVLVVNDTKVIPAQLSGHRKGREGGVVSIEATLFKDEGGGVWRAFVRPAKRLREGDVVEFGALTATVQKREGAEAELAFEREGRDFEDALERDGAAPLPPYIARKRAVNDGDRDRYQTVYADERGSVAAPTAGLHFTDRLLAELDMRDVRLAKVTLHVGAGTFLPVTVEDTRDHKMHSEWGEITVAEAETINEARAAGGRVVAVGTTSMRLLESSVDEKGVIRPFADETDIFITPGYDFRAVDMLMTNFHLPRSTLFMLVSAFSGAARMKAAYAQAVEAQYRFYSYGDACLLERMRDE
ncbi:MAG: tRNA preQ1(34) S-adenosylmethionine ribosyltransferase-isomerase QueA [Pseudomonadota bacterium]